ncbi:MAG: sensor histidine kinase, partial [Polymorphobacter sp.]
LANRSAADLLESSEGALAGSLLREIVPELVPLLDLAVATGAASGQVRIARGNETQTLAVQMAVDAGTASLARSEPGAQGAGAAGAVDRVSGLVVTFDDISEQLADQRSAAWADVARRIAHEIKNPLTPIQLSAERLQRKYGPQISSDPETFASLTSTIVRQVGDLRRMVDEFSEFARMPKPVFRAESVLDMVRQTMFLHEVGYPTVRFVLDAPDQLPLFECDRQQISQALTNLLKNAAEAVLARVEADALHAEQFPAADRAPQEPGQVGVSVWLDDQVVDGRVIDGRAVNDRAGPARLTICIEDNGTGLPVEHRERLTEPYVTTRARGTGLGLAIVKKIVEEHGGNLELGDRDGGGARALLHFDLGIEVETLASQRRERPAPANLKAASPKAASRQVAGTVAKLKQQG